MRLPFRQAADVAWCSTMATDGYHVFYNPEWTSRLEDAELCGVLAHEVLHVLLEHPDRRASREPELWNAACDYAINALLREQGFQLPEGGLYLPAFAGMPAERIYEKLIQFPDLAALHRKPPSGRYGTSGARDDDEYDLPGSVPAAGADLLDPNDPRVRPLRDADTPDAAQRAELCAELRRAAASKLHGNAAAWMAQECSAADASRVDWRATLRQWLSERIKSDWSLWPCSKKHIHRGLYLPSSGIQAPGHIVFAIDTSGSMNSHALSELIAELRAFRETFPSKLTVVQADAAVRDVQTYGELDGTEIPKTMTMRGRGGTDFRPVFEWVEEHAPDALIIYATDGYGTYPESAGARATIWLLTQPSVVASKVPFGSVVSVA
jgi:predicted metal-dependent peptidase